MGRRVGTRNESALTRVVDAVFAFVRFAEFEIFFFLFFVIAYVVFKEIENGKKNIEEVLVGIVDRYASFFMKYSKKLSCDL